jgi:Cu-processing system permease protein
MLLAASAITAERERGFLAVVAARGVSRDALVVSVWLAATAAARLGLLVGFGAVALILAGNVPMSDMPTFAGLVLTTMLVAAAAAAIGVLVGSAAGSRLQATLLALAVWFVFAIGLELLVMGLGNFLRAGEPGLLAAVATNPLSACRMAALLLIDQRGAVLGPVGTYALSRLALPGTVALLMTVLAAWTALPLLAARQVLGRRDL